MNKVTYQSGYVEIHCNNSKIVKIDTEDYERIKNHKICLNKRYAVVHINRKEFGLLRILFPDRDSGKARRKNGDSLDYRKSNLYFGNEYYDKGDYYVGICFGGEEFKIDKEDYALVSKYEWHVDSNGYVIAKIGGNTVKQHRLVLNLGKSDKVEVDHINHDRCDNRKKFLRITNRYGNCQNRRVGRRNKSGVAGVYKLPNEKWGVQITYNGRKEYVGSFLNLDDAVTARLQAERRCGFYINRQSAAKPRTEEGSTTIHME